MSVVVEGGVGGGGGGLSWESQGVKGELFAINVSPQEQCSYTAPLHSHPTSPEGFFFFHLAFFLSECNRMHWFPIIIRGEE